jgi:hypothetical protein
MTEDAIQRGLPVSVETLQRAEKITRMTVDFVGVEDGALPPAGRPPGGRGYQRFAGGEGPRGRGAARENRGRRFRSMQIVSSWRMLRLKRSKSSSTSYERRRLEASGGLGMRRLTDKNGTEREGRGLFLWDRIIVLLEQDLDWRRSRKLFVTLKGECGSYQKEIGELSASERRSLAPALGGYVADQLIGRYLAEQGSVDLFEGRHAYTKRIRDLAPTDLPALIEAERHRVKECQKEQERAEFAEVVRRDLDRLELVAGTD